MTQTIDVTQLPMREEIIVLDTIANASKIFTRDPQEIMEAAKLVQLRRIADALERLSPRAKPITSWNHDADEDPLE